MTTTTPTPAPDRPGGGPARCARLGVAAFAALALLLTGAASCGAAEPPGPDAVPANPSSY